MVKIFVSDICPHCEEIKKKIQNSKCNFEVINISDNWEEVHKYNIRAVPTVVLDDGTQVSAFSYLEECECKLKEEETKKETEEEQGGENKNV